MRFILSQTALLVTCIVSVTTQADIVVTASSAHVSAFAQVGNESSSYFDTQTGLDFEAFAQAGVGAHASGLAVAESVFQSEIYPQYNVLGFSGYLISENVFTDIPGDENATSIANGFFEARFDTTDLTTGSLNLVFEGITPTERLLQIVDSDGSMVFESSANEFSRDILFDPDSYTLKFLWDRETQGYYDPSFASQVFLTLEFDNAQVMTDSSSVPEPTGLLSCFLLASVGLWWRWPRSRG